MLRSKPRTLIPVLPNAGIAAKYRKELDAMIRRMFRRIKADARANYKGIVQDASWSDDFYADAEAMARKYGRYWNGHVRASMLNALVKAGYAPSRLTVLRRQPEDLQKIIDGIVKENIDLITSIPAKVNEQINKLVSASVANRRDMGALVKELEKIEGMTARRARTIARDQNNKATEAISMVRTQSLGITEGIWMHRGGAKAPRESHVRMNGTRFKLDEGCFDEEEGRNIWPGEMINCHCTYYPVLPDLE
jgi:SPP1 gp7 family putative phage head morphogenesis protein